MNRLVGTILVLMTLPPLVPRSAAAATFSELYVFGDSLSDTGNIFAATGGLLPPDPPYYQGRFSDGRVWVEHLAEQLDLPLAANGADPSVVQGNNFAAGAARIIQDVPVPPLGTIPSILSQVQYFIGALDQAPADALYVVWGGYNDLRIATDPTSDLDHDARQQMIAAAAEGLDLATRQLVDRGARQFLVANLADLGLTPEARVLRQNVELSTEATITFNSALAAMWDDLEAELPVQLFRLDVFALANQVVVDARDNGGAIYGITNLEMPIFAGVAGSPGADPATSMFADSLHISAAVHRHLGEAAATMVPEPTSWLLAVTALLLISVAFPQRESGR